MYIIVLDSQKRLNEKSDQVIIKVTFWKRMWNQKMQITLRAARSNLGLTRKEAAKLFSIHPMQLTRFEYDSTDIPRSFFIQLESVYGIPVENLYFGSEHDYIENMKNSLFKEVNTMT